MYCTKCGKLIDGDASLCPECEAKAKAKVEADSAPQSATAQNTTVYTAPPQPAPQQTSVDPTNSVMYGFGKALTSTILGLIGYFFAIIAYYGSIGSGMAVRESSIVLYVLMTLLSIPFFILSIIFGPKSIKAFVAQKNAGKKKPIPALVLGIVGTVFAGLTAVYVLLGFIVMIALV